MTAKTYNTRTETFYISFDFIKIFEKDNHSKTSNIA